MSAPDDPAATPIVVPGPPDAASEPLQASATPAVDPPMSVDVGHVPKQDTESVNELTPGEVESVAFLTQVAGDDSDHRTKDAQRLAIIAAVEDGMEPRQASIKFGVNLRTTYRILSQAENHLEFMRGAFRKVLIAKALRRLEDWETASEVGARKKGNHAPARDWLLHAGVIDPLDTDAPNVRVAIVIGTDEKPMRVRSPLADIDLPPAADAGE